MTTFLLRLQRELNEESVQIGNLIHTLEKEKKAVSELGLSLELIKEGQIPDEMLKEFAGAMADLHHKEVYESLFVTCSSSIEASLDAICIAINWSLKTSMKSYSKYSEGQGIERSRNYLKEALNINISLITMWADLKANDQIKGILKIKDNLRKFPLLSEEQPEYQFLKSEKGIELIETDYAFIQDLQYIKKYHEKGVEFINEIYRLVSEKLK